MFGPTVTAALDANKTGPGAGFLLGFPLEFPSQGLLHGATASLHGC